MPPIKENSYNEHSAARFIEYILFYKKHLLRSCNFMQALYFTDFPLG